MTHVIETLAGILVAGWLLHQILRFALGARFAAGMAYGVAFLGALIPNVGWGLWMAVMTPFGVMLPILCVVSSARELGFAVDKRLSRGDLVALSICMSSVLLGSMGLLGLSPYAWFYTGIAPACLALVLALWAIYRAHFVMLWAVVLAQILWLTDIGSSNLYDHLSHFMLLPAALLALILRRGSQATPRP